MKKAIRNNRFFLFPMLVIWIVLAFVLIHFSKTEIHLFINQHYSLFFDYFFRLYTNVGDGIMPVILSVLFLFFSVRKALIIGMASSLAGIVAQIFKRFVFPDEIRPKLFFENVTDYHFVQGVDLYSRHSFPSGHTATAFSVFFVLAFLTKSELLKVIFLILAMLVAYSRMYLSQHFLCDVYFGALIGLVSGIFSVWFLNRFSNNKLDLPVQNMIK